MANYKSPFQYFQMMLLEQAFYKRDIPVDKIAWYINALLPRKYFIESNEGGETLTKDLLKQEIIKCGSAAYEAFFDAAIKAEQIELATMLNDHNVKLLYRYVWIYNEDNSIMKRSKGWYTDREMCLKVGKQNMPSYATFDGPGAPYAHLTVESSCLCYIYDIEQHNNGKNNNKLILEKCKCFTPIIPHQFLDKSTIELDGIKVVHVAISQNFTYPPTYNYMLKPAMDKFSSVEREIYLAYMDYKHKQSNKLHYDLSCELGKVKFEVDCGCTVK